ncbi:Y-family DNA polymerase [Shewanella sp. SG44-6]|jgi:DNA polymerase V|uniref:Y-family DNA polymerase n=1 Tax=Shewanella sp. SG44-6 TaxID=2760959 RepID=UPI001604287A|nr:Y-family DNA polymerase [Shewanella sp. SG44-6]MBB1389818.1 Y-family DNA polymerase [Shewanella sp. SG44-6]
MIYLCDIDNFYASAECVFNPSWRGKPLIVLSNNDQVIVSLSKAAKLLGIKKFTPYYEAKHLCDLHNVIVCSSNYALYGALSNRVMNCISQFTEPFNSYVYSCDEIFLNLKCTKTEDYLEQAHKIRRKVWKQIRLPISIGVGINTTMAKVASHAAKKLPGYAGVCFIDNDEQRQSILSQMKTDDIWGVGARTAKKIEALNIVNGLQLSQMSHRLARENFGVELERAVLELNGYVGKYWDLIRADKIQIFSTSTLGRKTAKIEELSQAISQQVESAAVKARSQGSYCSTMYVFASASNYDHSYQGFKSNYHFDVPTNDTCQLSKAASEIVNKLFRNGSQYYRVGVGLLNLTPVSKYQHDLFNQPANPNLMKIFDSINAAHGKGTIFNGARGIEQKWKMRREYLTPQYLTKWSDIPKVNC